ncbi:MAG: flagellar hook-length control protein FliK [Silicimonas sp.]|nr:flagellar hook-length control protein FliK [Silicimonas sp.]
MPPDEPPVPSRPGDLGKPHLSDAPLESPDRSSVEPTRHLRRHRDVEHHGHDTGPRASATSTAIALPVVPASVKLVPGTDGTILKDLGDRSVHGDSELVSIEQGGRARVAAPEHVRQEQPAARSVVTQIVQSVTRSQASNVIEVRLQPEELGRVRLTLTPSDSGIAVQIVAERTETLDLLRRNIDLLAEDLNRRGFSDLDFSFEGGSTSPDRDFEHQADAEEGPTQESLHLAAVEPTTRNTVSHSGRLDIRL